MLFLMSRVKVRPILVPGALILREALLVIPDPYTGVEVDGTQVLVDVQMDRTTCAD
jgi:hypothetical protein